MTRTFILLFLLFSPLLLKAQGNREVYSHCLGSLNIFESNAYKLKFQGVKKESSIFSAYPALSNITSGNQLWISYIAPLNGTVSFQLKSTTSNFKFVIFQPFMSDVCSEIPDGMAEIKRMMISENCKQGGLDTLVNATNLYPMHLDAGQSIYIVIIGEPETISDLHLNFVFTPDVDETDDLNEKELDFRNDEFAPTFKICIRNAETNKPVIANLSIDGLKGLNGLYKGSDLLYNVPKNFRMNVKCEAEGFFFIDSTEITVSSMANQELVLKLEPVRSGKTMQIEEIEFTPGTSEFVPNGEGKLRRLRDFLALNSDIRIEIQGHVYEPGGHNSHAGQKISEARAKRVMKYLIDNGIEKSRLTAVGYGNTRPIYAEPKHGYEEQANRRVEIVVL